MELLTKISLAFEHGGFWMYPILLIQLASFAIAIDRIIALFVRRKANQLAYAASFEDNIRRGEMQMVESRAQKTADQNPLGSAIAAGAHAARMLGGKEEIQGKMDEVLIAENAFLDRRTGFLALLGNVATLTGLLGTITGMIKSFAAVAYANPAEKATMLAAGISEAMNATAYGLIVAIPALVMYGFFTNRATHLAEDLNQGALKVFNWLSYTYEAVQFQPKGARHAGDRAPEINA